MYLGILLLSFFSFDLIHAEAFTCPTCSVGGADKDEVLAACDRTIRDEVCGQEEPMCEVSMHVFKSGRVRVNRWCTDQKTRQANKVACETYGNCPKTAYCTESGCKAVLEKKEKVAACPSCFGEGNTMGDANTNCDKEITMEDCWEEDLDPVCMVVGGSSTTWDGDRYAYIDRFCVSREMFNERKASCESTAAFHCTVAMCEETGCKAKLPE